MSTETLTSAETQVDALVEQLLSAYPPTSTDALSFLGAQFDAGLAFVHFPQGCGGLELAPVLQQRINRALGKAKAPTTSIKNVIGLGMIMPTIATHGTQAQKDRYLRKLFSCEEIWCQLFSEPGAGSDVASLATRAERDGDEWVLNGQKVWTTLAHLSDYGLIVARTDPDAPKHSGMTCFLVDLKAPGVEVRPLYQITGEAEFNEVFFTDVRVSDADRLGGVGEGWHVAITTLMNERVSIGGQVPPRGAGPIADAVALFQENREAQSPAHEAATRDRLMQLWIESEINRLTNQRAADSRKAGTPGPEGSVAKLAHAELNQRMYEFCVDLMGAKGMLFPDDYPKIRPDATGMGRFDARKLFLRVRANSIEGGTSEVMRNILGERVLGLPGEPRADKGMAWKDVPRS